jgi:DNA topoisomerase-1
MSGFVRIPTAICRPRDASFGLTTLRDQHVEVKGSDASADVNIYLREITGTDLTAKDFRTWFGTVLAATALREFRHADSKAAAKRNTLRAIEAVAGVLGNTPAVCRTSYIHPAILECYLDRSMERKLSRALPPSVKRVASKLRPDEVTALRILHRMRPAAHRTRAA